MPRSNLPDNKWWKQLPVMEDCCHYLIQWWDTWHQFHCSLFQLVESSKSFIYFSASVLYINLTTLTSFSPSAPVTRSTEYSFYFSLLGRFAVRLPHDLTFFFAMSSMEVTMAAVPALPPTANTLDSVDRAHLIRSIRKLKAVLGETPCLVDASEPMLIPKASQRRTPKALKRQGSLFSHKMHGYTQSLHTTSLSASLVSLPDIIAPRPQSAEVGSSEKSTLLGIRSRSLADKRRPLYLCLNTVTASQTVVHHTPPTTPTSCAAMSDVPVTPCTPTMPAPDPIEFRRKRIAKLARHLGESIPPELVLLSVMPEPLSSQPCKAEGQDLLGSNIIWKDSPFVPVQATAAPIRSQDWVGPWNRSNIFEVQKRLRNLKVR